MKKLIFTVTSDLSYDQRMIRICTSLAGAGYHVLLVGRRLKNSPALEPGPYLQKRIPCIFNKGKLFYAEFNIRLFFYLLFKKAGGLCAIDLDTILPVYLVSRLKGVKRIYDAHEYFSQQKEILSRPGIYKIWYWIERKMIPRFKNGYTVSQSIAETFKKEYGANYEVIRNMPLLKERGLAASKDHIILYQGAVNEARGLEYLIPAMKQINAPLHIYGDGNFLIQAKALATANNLQEKLLFMGKLAPAALEEITATAAVGINLVENNGLNQYYSLANKFFDYMHHALPQVSMNFPEYKRVNDAFEVALLIDTVDEKSIAGAINTLLNDKEMYHRLQQNCLAAREIYNWQQEEKILVKFYKDIIG